VVEESEADEVPSKRYVLRAITDTRIQNGVKQYLVKWSGYSGATWEPASLIQEDAPKAVQEYETLLNDRAAVRSAVTTRSQARAASAATSSGSSATTRSPATATSDPDTDDDESEVSLAAAYAARRL